MRSSHVKDPAIKLVSSCAIHQRYFLKDLCHGLKSGRSESRRNSIDSPFETAAMEQYRRRLDRRSRKEKNASSRRPLFRDMASPNLSRNFADPMEELIHCFATSLIH
eukprot:scaffold1882_cov181-Skeletonema_marinoi.AAC.10